MVRTELTADDSLAAMRARSRLGIAMAAMIKMIATTISNSISEKPFCFFIKILSPSALRSCTQVCYGACFIPNEMAARDNYLAVYFLRLRSMYPWLDRQ